MEILLDVPITFDAADGTTHAPMVQADVNGTETLLILDTGSTDHILTTELTGRLGLELEEGEEGTDSSGASVRSWLLSEARITIAARAFALRDLVVIDPPPPFTAGGIGGALSPQHLDPTAWAVLDMVTDRFRLVEATEGLQPWLSATRPELVPIELDAAGGDGVLLVRAGIDAHDSVVTMIDTGAPP